MKGKTENRISPAKLIQTEKSPRLFELSSTYEATIKVVLKLIALEPFTKPGLKAANYTFPFIPLLPMFKKNLQ